MIIYYSIRVSGANINNPEEEQHEKLRGTKPKEVIYGVFTVKGDKKPAEIKAKKPEAKPDNEEENEKDELLLSNKVGVAIEPNEPINNEYINNLKVMSDPIYKPENYIFVN